MSGYWKNLLLIISNLAGEGWGEIWRSTARTVLQHYLFRMQFGNTFKIFQTYTWFLKLNKQKKVQLYLWFFKLHIENYTILNGSFF